MQGEGRPRAAAPARVIRVAQGSLKGVVYYNSYDSKLARAGAEKDYGAIMRIRPGATAEVYQGGQAGGCTVCHNVSANGNVILTTRENPSPGEGRSNYVSRVTNTSTNASVRNQDDGSFVWGGLSPNGDLTLSNGVPPIASRKDEWGPIVVGSGRIGLDDRPSRLYDTKTGTVIPTPSWDAKVRYAYMPSFSPDGKRVTYNDYSNVGSPTAGKILGVADFDPASKTFANVTQLTTDPQFVGWPIVTPDSKSVVYGSVSRDDYGTWGDARGDLKIVHVASKTVASLDRLNGVENGKVTLPAGENEAHRNFEPTILPQPVGGYFWVVFTSRRKIGNVVATDDAANPARKKLWVAALDIPPAELPSTKATDTSHPAFYLEGQELEAGNMRGFWSLDQCKNTGTTCEPGVDDCCDGYCRQDASASGTAFTCVAKKDGCSKEAERCDTAADCCDVDAQATCTNGKCVKATPR
ncbi:MAG: hypothetical protein U0169_13095 [Polyangiaceae bacterium]